MNYLARVSVHDRGDAIAELIAIVRADSAGEAQTKLEKLVTDRVIRNVRGAGEVCPRGGRVDVEMSVGVKEGSDFLGLLVRHEAGSQPALVIPDPYREGTEVELWDETPSQVGGMDCTLVKPAFERPSLKELLKP